MVVVVREQDSAIAVGLVLRAILDRDRAVMLHDSSLVPGVVEISVQWPLMLRVLQTFSMLVQLQV